MSYKIHALSIFEYCQRKDKDGNPHQEDCIYPAIGKTDDNKDRLFILCDGMGGHSAGEVASLAVCEAMSRVILTAINNGEDFTDALLQKALTAAYDLLDARDKREDEQKKMGTTMTLLMLHKGGYTIAHIGDSRVYHIRPDKGTAEDVVFRTEDHSLVNDLLRIGELTPDEAETYPHKNVITRAMQPHLERRPKADIHTSCDIRPGDYFYMCSDGMLEQMSDSNICFTIADNISDEEKVARLVKLTKKNRDNHSAHLIHVLDVPPLPQDAAGSKSVILPQAEDDDEDNIVTPEFEDEEDQRTDDKASVGNITGGSASSSKTEETRVPLTRRGAAGNATSVNKGKGMPRAIGLVLALLVVAVCGALYWFFNKEKEAEAEPQPPLELTSPNGSRKVVAPKPADNKPDGNKPDGNNNQPNAQPASPEKPANATQIAAPQTTAPTTAETATEQAGASQANASQAQTNALVGSKPQPTTAATQSQAAVQSSAVAAQSSSAVQSTESSVLNVMNKDTTQK